METELIPKKELEAYKSQLVQAEKYSTTLEVKTDDDYHSALGEAKHIKEQLEIVTSRKEAITKPLNVALKSVRALFTPLESMGENALAIVRGKMLTYANAKEVKAQAKIEKIDQRLENGKISEAEANVKKFMAAPQTTISTGAGSATTRKVKKYYVVEKSKIPLDFLEPDMVRIKASFKAGMPVAGIEERLEIELAIK